MQLEVFESDADAIDAAATLAERLLAASTTRRPGVALAGGRGGRALMVALATRDGVPWERARFCVADDASAVRVGEVSNRQLLQDYVLAGRGVRAGADGTRAPVDAGAWAAAYTADVEATGGPDLTFDLVLLELGARGELGALAPGDPALADPDVGIVRVGDERIGLGPAALRRARNVIVVAVGAHCREALARAMQPADGTAVPAGPARWVLPSPRTTWFVDRAAAALLLRAARAVRA